MFQFAAFAPPSGGARPSAGRVSPFGHPRIIGHLRLPAAFRSLSRPSSPPRATGIPRAPFSFSFPHPRLPTGLLVFSVSLAVNELSRHGRDPAAHASVRLPGPPVRLVVPSGVEPLTPTLSVWCSDQLSYGTGLSNLPDPPQQQEAQEGNPLQKGGIPATPSGTATLLRLSPSHRFCPRALLPVTHFRHPQLPWLDGRCVQGPGTYSPRHG